MQVCARGARAIKKKTLLFMTVSVNMISAVVTRYFYSRYDVSVISWDPGVNQVHPRPTRGGEKSRCCRHRSL